MKVKLTDSKRGIVHIWFDSPEELKHEYFRHIVSKQLVVPISNPRQFAEDKTYTIVIVLPNNKRLNLEGHILKKQNEKAMFSLTGITPEIENILRKVSISTGNEHKNTFQERKKLIDGYDSFKHTNLQNFLSQVSLPELKFHAERLRQICEALVEVNREKDAAFLISQLGKFVSKHTDERTSIIAEQLKLCARQEIMQKLLDASLKATTENMPTFAEALSFLGESALPYLLKLLELSADSRTRLKALDTLINAKDAVKPLILSELSKPQNKWYYLRNLLLIAGKIKATEALPIIEKHLADENAAVRAEALAAFVRIKGKAAESAIVGALSDTSSTVVKTAIRLIGELGEIPEGAQKFFKQLFASKTIHDEELLIEALRAVASVGKNAQFLEKHLIKLLDRFKPPNILQRLLNAKDNRPVGVMLGLFAALGSLRTRKAIKALKKRLKQERDPWYESIIKEEIAKAEANRNA